MLRRWWRRMCGYWWEDYTPVPLAVLHRRIVVDSLWGVYEASIKKARSAPTPALRNQALATAREAIREIRRHNNTPAQPQ